MGQISGTLFVILFEAIGGGTGMITFSMLLFVAVTAVEIPVALKMKESDIIKNLRGTLAKG